MLEVVATFAAAHGWTVLRFDTTQAQHELLLKAPGLSGTEEILWGCVPMTTPIPTFTT